MTRKVTYIEIELDIDKDTFKNIVEIGRKRLPDREIFEAAAVWLLKQKIASKEETQDK